MQIPNTIEQSFKVDYNYKLHFTTNLFDSSNSLLADILKSYNAENKVKILFVIDEGVYKAHPLLENQIENYCELNNSTIELKAILVVPGGEQVKVGDKHLNKVLQGINDFNICRHSFVAVIGGGAVIDMVGYACAIAHRGVKLLRIPTTVLSQNDSAVGVKNSVNYFGKKNFLGTFALPYAIINDNAFLETLEQRDWVSGISEAIKVALIKDKSFYNEIVEQASKLKNRDVQSMQYLIYKCALLHMEHISKGGDPFENGSSRPLDFGHWAAHKMEHMTNYSVRHGEAVALGMAIDVTYAKLIGLIDEATLQSVLQVIKQVGFNLKLPIPKQDVDELLNGIEEFREHLGGKLTITLISEIGKKHDVHDIDTLKMKEAVLAFYK
ncbi:3-dehydroquinate synthase [Flavobacteriaceae bacterium XHP0103]|uniref:3-dehydroquinate synthase n=1 Tax=Marixanthotalea marina TaxID=2844359 RepID=UPI002989A63E|nr:3-dehydroquinate synthase [Marixanthotalea marina]MBU3823090.1 3-dehydroquinate synthase [Marixanthotalea marina]